MHEPVLLRTDACTGDLEQTVRAVVSTHFHKHASVTSDRIAFLAKEKVV